MDERLFRLINRQWTGTALDRLMAAVSALDVWAPLLIVLVILVAWRGGRRARMFLVTVGILLAVGDGLMDRTLKHWIHRLRPYQAMANVREVDLARHARPRMRALFEPLSVTTSAAPPDDANATDDSPGRSFPSSHVVNNVCVAVAFFVFYRRWGWLYFAVAALVAYSRVYVGAHWPSDVVFSACLAAGYSVCLLTLWQWIVLRFRPSLWPEVVQVPVVGRALLMKMSPARWVLVFLLILTALRLAFIGQVELSPDEAYYQMWSQHLDWGYYSKGPGVALAIRAGTALCGINEFGVRLLAPLLALATSLILFALARRLYGLSVAVWVVILLSALPISQAGSLLMTIDPLSIAFWSAGLWACWAALRWHGVIFLEVEKLGWWRYSPAWKYWLLTGLCIGLGFLCKYTNAMELLSVVLAMLLVPRWRVEFRRPGFYLMLGTAVLSGCPPILWNASHAWVTFHHLRARGGFDNAFSRPLHEFGDFLSAQAAVYTPLVFLGILLPLWWAWRQAWQMRPPPLALEIELRPAPALTPAAEKARFLLAFGLPLLVMYAVLAFKTAGEPNWPAPGFISLSILAVAFWHERARRSRAARVYCLCALLVALPVSALMLDTDLARQAGVHWPYQKDPTARLLGWRDTARAVADFRQEEERTLGGPVFLIANRYQLAAELNFYLPPGAPVSAGHPAVYLPQSQDLETQFSFWPSYDETIVSPPRPENEPPPRNAEEEFKGIRESPYIGRSALFITDDDRQRRLPDAIETGFEETSLVAEYVVQRRGLPLRHLHIYACFNYKGLDL